jgi:hypothetical protein
MRNPVFLSGKHWSLAERYFSRKCVAFRRFAVRSFVAVVIVIIIFQNLCKLLTINVSSNQKEKARRFSVC